MADEGWDLLERAARLRRNFGRLRDRVGTIGAVLTWIAIAIGSIWWFWDDIAKRPGVEQIVARMSSKEPQFAVSGHLALIGVPNLPPGVVTVKIFWLRQEGEGIDAIVQSSEYARIDAD